MRPNHYFMCLVSIVFLATITGLAQLPAHMADSTDEKLLHQFKARASRYLEWREKAAGKAPASSDSPQKLGAERHELANKIRMARAGKRQGEIFTPEIAQYFRRTITNTLTGNQGRPVRSTLRDAEPVKGSLQINQSYPEDLPLQSTPPSLLRNLPQLPNGLEYRILGRELVLRDADANIVVDYVPDALPARTK